MRLLDDVTGDVRYALRGLARTPVVTAIAVLSLALGIGANTAIFSVVDALMVRSLPVTRPEELVALVREFPGRGTTEYITYPGFERFRDAGIFSSLSASMTTERSGARVIGPNAPAPATWRVGLVSGSYFHTLGLQPAAGRLLSPDDDRAPGASAVAVLSGPFWRRAFGASADAVGRAFALNGTTFTIVGVVSGTFAGEDVDQVTDVFVPVSMASQVMPEREGLLRNTESNWIRAVGRLKPGSTPAQAEAAAQAVFATLPATGSQFGHARLQVQPVGRGFSIARQSLATPLLVLGIAVGLVLLMACANVAMLVLVSVAARRRELAIRVAIGAGRARLARHLFTENLVLGVIAGIAGFATAVGLTRVLLALAGSGRMPFGLEIQPDVRMLGITAGVSMLTIVLCGVLPSLRASRSSPAAALTGAPASVESLTRPRLRVGRVLVVVQVAASIVLVAGATLFARTLGNLEGQHLGFDRDHVWLFWMAPGEAGRTGPALAALLDAAQQRVAAIPGVVSASASTDGVLSGFIGLRTVAAEGHSAGPAEDSNAEWNLVGERFFQTMGMRLLAGRDVAGSDTAAAPRVAVVNETMARRFFGEAAPLGKRFAFGRDLSQPIEIVGVVEDAKYFSARDDAVPMVFLPYRQDQAHVFRFCVSVRVATDAPGLVRRIREELGSIDPAVPVGSVTTTADQLSRTLSEERMTAWLSGFFGGLAVLLACLGLFGVMSYSVSRRTREIGIRIALGESRASVLRRVLRESLALVCAGIAIGAPAALAGQRSIQALLFGVAPGDVFVVGAAAAMVVVVALVAAWIPARRAATVNPLVALRAD